MNAIEFYTSKGWKLISPYGNRLHPIEKVIKFHYGVDIGRGRGTPIPCCINGVVSGTWTSIGTAGRAVVVKDGKGKVFRFFHLDRIDVKKGQIVKQGDIIGLEGASGGVTGPHLHLEIGNDNGTDFGLNMSKNNPADYIVVHDTATSYKVQSGDSLYKIGQRFGVTVQELVNANKGKYPSLATNPGLISVGWVLAIPQEVSSEELSRLRNENTLLDAKVATLESQNAKLQDKINKGLVDLKNGIAKLQ